MNAARRLLKKLLEDTEDELKNIANLRIPDNLQHSPYEAIRYFYPVIGFKDGKKTVYASRAAGKGRPSLLQELLLGIPVMIDISDAKPFLVEYGMTPDELAVEVKKNRLLPVTNASNPLEWSDDFIEYIKPILVQSIIGSLNPPTWPDASQTFGCMMIEQSRPSMSSRAVTMSCHQAALTLRLSSTPSGP